MSGLFFDSDSIGMLQMSKLKAGDEAPLKGTASWMKTTVIRDASRCCFLNVPSGLHLQDVFSGGC